MRIVQITTDNRNQFAKYSLLEPYFGTAPTGLFDGFREMPEVELHVVSCASKRMNIPTKLAENIWFHQPHVPKAGWGRSLFLGCAWSARQLIKSLKPDIVHGQGTERDCSMAAVLSGFPNVLTIHGNMRIHASRPEHSASFYYKMAASLETFCLKRTNGVVAISNYTKDLVDPLTARTWLLPNAVDRRFFEVCSQPLEIPRLLFVGSLDQRKNPLGLILACETMLRAGECTLALAGQFNHEGAYGMKVIALAESIPGLSFLGFMDRDALAREFSLSTILVLPTFEDNCPMVILEGMAAGLPVAASNVGGIPDLITHEENGLLFDPHLPQEMRSCLRRLVREPETCSRLAAAGRITARQCFHPTVIAERHVDIYREVLNR